MRNMTPHNKAKVNDIANIVLMSGDPLRAEYIAKKYLKNVRLVNSVRNMLTFTGTYKGKKITVMGHGMGMPSIGIYSYELFKFYNVKYIIRLGSCGSYKKDINVGDVFVVSKAFAKTSYAKDVGVKNPKDTLDCSTKLLKIITNLIKNNKNVKIGQAFSEDVFYNKYSLNQNIKRSKNSCVVEMEAYALYANAIYFKKDALTLLTCSDSFVTNKTMTPEERQESFNEMINLAFSLVEKIK